jgi:DNA invertase Pin-like site-specific DNA recombinase
MKGDVPMSKIFGYARCSTNESKQDVQRQKRELKERGATDETIFMEYESGTKIDRPELNKLLGELGHNPGSTLITTEVSRITRSTKQLCDIIETAKELRLKLIIGGFVVDCTNDELDPMTEGMLKMMGVFAEMERKMTIDRIKSGLKNAKAKGVKLGRPALTIADVPKKVVEYFERFQDKAISKVDYARVCGITRPTLDKYIAVMVDR